MSLYFARHGQTVFNLENRFQGLSDSPLTDLGKAQARRLGEFAKQAGVTNLIVSPRGRAIETAKIVIEALGQDIPVVIDQIWREMCYGDWEGRAESEIVNEPAREEWLRYQLSFTYPGNYQGHPGDSYVARYAELIPTFEFLTKHFPARPTLIVAHYTPLRFVRKYFDRLSDDEAMAYEPAHDRLLDLTMIDGRIQLTEEALP